MKQEVEQFKKLEKELKDSFRVWVTDRNIPLKERFDLFLESGLGDHRSSVDRFNCKIGKEFPESLEDRYETISIERILEWVENEEDHDTEFSIEEINEFKENVLSSFVKSYTFDW